MKPPGLLHDGLGVLHRQSAVHGRRVTVCLIRVRSSLKVMAKKSCPICFAEELTEEAEMGIHPRSMMFGRKGKA